MTLDKQPHRRKRLVLSPEQMSNHYFDWAGGSPGGARAEEALWIAVITQAMMDALCRPCNAEQDFYRFEALEWLTGSSRDFLLVCEYAGFHPDYIRRRAKRALLAPKSWRAEAGTGKRFKERQEYRRRMSLGLPPVSMMREMEVIA